jgi:hypothetical protein
MNRLIIFLISICYTFSAYSEEGTVDTYISYGYTTITIDNTKYKGHTAFWKLLIPFTLVPDLYLGLGFKFDHADVETPSLSPQTHNNHLYESVQAGLDFAYKLQTESVDFLLNPYVYYSFYDTWLQVTQTNTTRQSYEPIVSHNVNVGVGLSILYKYVPDSDSFIPGSWYLGPAFYYTWAYLSRMAQKDDNGNIYPANEGSYNYYSVNFTIGTFF